MKPDIEYNARQKRSLSVILALAVISLLAGASVSTSVDDFVEPRYAEDNPYAGVVDDAVGDATWEQLEKNEKGLKGKLKSFLSDRVDISEEDRKMHLQKRVEANEVLTKAFQFCIDNVECDADSEVLTVMLFSMDSRVNPMMKEVNLDMEDWEEKKDDWDDEKVHCLALTCECDRRYCGENNTTIEIDWEEKKDDWEDAVKEGEAPPNPELRDKKMSIHPPPTDWKNFDGEEFIDKMTMIENGAIAISYCISNSDCAGLSTTSDDRHSFNSILNKIGEEMANRHADYQECYEGQDCEREGKEEQKRTPPGLISRISDNLQRDDTPLTDRDDLDRDDFRKFEITQEMCESRLGSWIVDDDKSYCLWSLDDKDCSDPDCRDGEQRMSSDGCNECICDSGNWSCTEKACENSEEDREESEQDDSDDETSSQESCEESGGTWSEDRQTCY
tara:strand:+ start:2376 stop:3713 length:1338 start_codon:yes stop_codon:yes gene_type:complete